MAHVVAQRGARSPFPTVQLQLPARYTLGEMLDEVQWPLRLDRFTEIRVDGVAVDRARWDDYEPGEGSMVHVLLRPAGGDSGKQILAAVAIIAIAVVAWYAAPLLAPALGITSELGVSALAAGITMVGSLLIGALFKPPMPAGMDQLSGGDAKPGASMTSQSNQATPFGVVPKVYGRMKVFPKIAAVPYTVNLSGANYLHALYDFGYAEVTVEDIAIGATSIIQYNGVDYVIHPRWKAGDNLSLFNADSTAEGLVVTLNQTPDTGLRTSVADTVQAVIDIAFPSGLYLQHDNGEISAGAATFEMRIDGARYGDQYIDVQFSRSGPRYTKYASGPGLGQLLIQNNTTRDPFYMSVWLKMPAPGAHTIQVIRLDGPPIPQAQYAYKATWTQFRAIQNRAPLNLQTEHTIMELRVRASDQLSGTIDTLSAVVTSVLPVWNGTTWTDTPSRNPAWIYCDILRGNATNRPMAEARIDLPEMLAWAAECDAEAANDPGEAQFRCDVIFDYRATVREALQTVAACGRAALNMRDGRFSVMRESADAQIVQLVTKRNSWNLTATMPYLDKVHGLNVKYLDDQTWLESTVQVYNDGYDQSTATLLEDLELIGITRFNQAWRFGRYYMAQAELRRERASFTMDVENIVCQRGDVIGLAYDTMKVGGFPARIKHIAGNNLILDAPLESAAVDAIRVRHSDERGLDDPVGITVVDEVTVTVADASGYEAGDLVVYGTMAVTVGDYIVDSVKPGPDLSATVDVLERRPEVLDADSGPIPDRIPKPGLNPDGTLSSPAPLLAYIQYDVSNYARQYDIELTWNRSPLATLYRVLLLDPATNTWREVGTTKDTRFLYTSNAADIPAGPVTFGVQAYSSTGLGSDIAQNTVNLDPVNDPWPAPPPPYGVTAVARDIDIEVRWQAYPYDFVDLYALRICNGAAGVWEVFVTEWQNKTLVMNLPPQLVGDHTILIKTVDPAKRQSINTGPPAAFTVLAPNEVTVIGTGISNTAFLRWGSLAFGDFAWSAQTTHRIQYYEIAKAKLGGTTVGAGASSVNARMSALDTPGTVEDFPGATAVGRSATEFAVLSEQSEGNWRYGVRAVDAAGNFAPWGFVDLILTAPDNYFLFDYDDNIIPEATVAGGVQNDGTLTGSGTYYYMPVDAAVTWQQHYVNNGWSTPQAQVDAGFPLYLQPADNTPAGTVVFEHDYGHTIQQTRLTVRAIWDLVALSPTVDCTVLTKTLPTDAYVVAFPGFQGILPRDTRFVRVEITATSSPDLRGILNLRQVEYTLDVHYQTDQGTATVPSGGSVHVSFNLPFNDVVAVILTPASTTVAYAQYVLDSDQHGMTVYTFNSSAAPVAGQVSWLVRGY